MLKYLIRLYKKRYKCKKGEHEWLLSSIFIDGDGNIPKSTYFCRNCMESFTAINKIVITGTTTISEAMLIANIANKPQPSWLDDLSHKVEKALEKNP